MMEQQAQAANYDEIFKDLNAIMTNGFNSLAYWPKWEKYLRTENNYSKILTDPAFLIRFANDFADGFNFLKTTFGDEYGEYIFDEEVLDSAIRKTKKNWNHFSDEQKKVFELQYEFYYGSREDRKELRLKLKELKRKAEAETVKDDDNDISDQKFEKFDDEKGLGRSTEDAMEKAKEVEKEGKRKESESESAKENKEEVNEQPSEDIKPTEDVKSPAPEALDEKAEQKEPAQSASPSDSTPPPSNDASENGKEEVAETKVAPPTTDTSTKNESEEKQEKVSQNVPLAPAPEANELFRQKILNDHLRHRLQSLEEELFNLRDERKELEEEKKKLEEEKGKLKDEKGEAKLGSNLQMQNLRSRIERLNLQLTDANKHRTELEENKIQQNLKLDEMTNELNEAKKKLLVLENSNQVVSEKELSESFQHAITQTSRIVLYCTALAVASIFLVIFAFVR
ncbi:MAG: hypothetical protein E7I13_06615 [Negativicoccus succinicivorans]|nr:hypothetical protein [Negativicoccus succinicivorans]